MEHGIWYKKDSEAELVSYSDSDYGGDVDDRKSTSRYVFMMACEVVS